jgi:hypothetical protein
MTLGLQAVVLKKIMVMLKNYDGDHCLIINDHSLMMMMIINDDD